MGHFLLNSPTMAPHVVVHHFLVSPACAVRLAKGVGIQLRADPHPGFLRQPLDHLVGFDILRENNRHLGCLDFFDKLGRVLGRWFHPLRGGRSQGVADDLEIRSAWRSN